ncbi:YpmS family protein [Enterococcus aquimarinus]|uniref:YpmS family protein n=1 Tax=Enterococcus aquimarinus TaxID=328396 RepID=A0A1L8QR01_9ENTE|nr:YpmS family protein [Enterococcus aquimarinus]MBP6359523.1 YpmS family protein [Enterococcus sp.]MBP7085737.1 YpmS family protein [Enterococcus sp.]MBP8693663.1 YpmS family protein [Enterococcus sp.]MBP9521408.1 YpmS family protein [Enterococcus sp.]MCC9272923.1 YpmS family protein [Enterococcus aquimarinus]
MEKKNVTLTKLNPWKAAFLFLVAVLIGGFLLLFTRLTQERENVSQIIAENVVREGDPVITINSNKEQVNRFVDFYLADLQKDAEQQYQFVLKNEALLTGEFDLLGFPVSFYLYFDPFVMANGNIQLKAKSLSIGALGLPINQVLKMIQNNSEIPEWIDIQPKEEMIILRLDQFELKNGMFFRADKINLVDNEIQLNVYLPE